MRSMKGGFEAGRGARGSDLQCACARPRASPRTRPLSPRSGRRTSSEANPLARMLAGCAYVARAVERQVAHTDRGIRPHGAFKRHEPSSVARGIGGNVGSCSDRSAAAGGDPFATVTPRAPLSSRGLGRRPLTAETGVRIPVAVLPNTLQIGGFHRFGGTARQYARQLGWCRPANRGNVSRRAERRGGLRPSPSTTFSRIVTLPPTFVLRRRPPHTA
jgi:hypothetical protein